MTLMSSLAQEESRSISENVTWGRRKCMADGKVSLAYSRFLGYDKGTEKYTMVINEEQAVIVRRIFKMFLQGYTPHTIATLLTKDCVTTPCGCDAWNAATIRRMLSNEKYKGDALLQKEFTVDFLQKKMKKNEGELPQYYVEGDHEAIISPWLFDYVQKRLKERGDVQGRYSGVTVLSSKLECGICGSMYTPRPWHSTSYNNLVWQCRKRYTKGKKSCPAFNIYDKLLHFSVHEIAMNAISQRNIEETVAKAVFPILPKERRNKTMEWLRDFLVRDIWKLQSDEQDIALIINRIKVMEGGTAKVYLLDDSVMPYTFPAFYPTRYKVEQSENQKLKKKVKKKKYVIKPRVKIPSIITECENCRVSIQQYKGFKRKRFCCNKCRNEWWNQHLDQVKKKAYYQISCQYCGKEFQVYGDKRKKYCSHECYVANRFEKRISKQN